MRFLADMGVSPRCVEWLCSQGYDAVHLCEQNLHQLPDSDVLRKAYSEKRILLTMDLDFSRLLSSAKANGLPLTIIFRLSDQRPQSVQVMIEKTLPFLKLHFKNGNAILSVTDNKIRIRYLPINYDE